MLSLVRDLATVIFSKMLISHQKTATFLKMYDFLLCSALPVISKFCWNPSGGNFSSAQAHQLYECQPRWKPDSNCCYVGCL